MSIVATPRSFASRSRRYRAVADLRDRTRAARRVGILDGLNRVDRDDVGLASPRYARTIAGKRRVATRPGGRARARRAARRGAAPARRLLGAHEQAPRAGSRPSRRAPAARSVLLPMPGSPPSSVSDPATSPPPSTRSSSGTPVGRRGGTQPGRRRRAGSGTDAGSARAALRAAPPIPRATPTRRSPGTARATSGDSWPHAEQEKRTQCSCHGSTVAARWDNEVHLRPSAAADRFPERFVSQ